LLETIDPQWDRDLILPPVPNGEANTPRLSLERIGTFRQFVSSLTALVRGPLPPKQFLGEPFFRDCWIERKLPKSSFVAAIVLQALLIRFPPPIWKISTGRTVSALPPMQLTWYGPIQDFPLVAPAPRAPKPVARKDQAKAPAPRGADAFHPRQTILSEPLHPTHPRQTLIQPKAPLEPPKILLSLPNIVQLAASQPARPKVLLTAGQLAALRPKTPRAFVAQNIAAPEIAGLEKRTGQINIASVPEAQPKPSLPVSPMSAPREAQQRKEANAAAPDIGGRTGVRETLIALSAMPAPVAPPAIPAGNLSAHVSISPDGSKPGVPGMGASSTGGGRGPEGISISGGSGTNTSQASGLGVGAASPAPGKPLPSRALSHLRTAPEVSNSLSSDAVAAAEATPKLGMSPQTLLGAKRVYTLHINMPNLTSVSGSWILNFAELNESPPNAYVRKEDAPDLAGPVPLKKVDPKYPPELRSTHVDGEVVLYAIIRKDGSVDSIQLVKSIDPVLDANAMEALAQWKFRPAEKSGVPVDLEAVVYIPFRSHSPVF
jgi:TonB family protein